MSKLTPDQMASIRTRSLASARKRVATEFGELILAREVAPEPFDSLEAFEAYAAQIRDSEQAHERDWTACFIEHYFRAFAYYCAFELSGADAEFAKECVKSPGIVAEIAHRAKVASEAVT
jgi:hypothetical protein